MNLRLFATAVAFTVLAAPPLAYAQQDANAAANSGSNSAAQNTAINGGSSANNGGVQVGPTTAGADSSSTAQQQQSLVNGGSSANNGGVFAPTNANSTSDSASISGSSSRSQGGNSTSDAHSTGGTSSAVTGASNSAANNAATNQGNAQNITFNSTTPNKTKLETTPQVYAPALSTTLTETCMGSTSGGISVMGFGGTLGTTWNDAQCVRRLNAREMAQTLGDRDAARALMCQDKDVAAAYAAVGQDCRQKYTVAVVVPPPAPVSPVVINMPPPPPAVMMAPVPNPPTIDRLLEPRHHRSTHKNVPACKVDPHYVCPAHD